MTLAEKNGGPGNDLIRGTPGRDRIDGGPGSDTLYGFAGDDRIWGDFFNGDPSADTDALYGGAGGLSATGSQFWSQDSPGVADTAEGGTTSAGPLHPDALAAIGSEPRLSAALRK